MSDVLANSPTVKRVRVKLIGVLASAAGNRTLELETSTSETVSSIIRKLLDTVGNRQFREFLVDSATGDPRTNVIILVNEQDCNISDGLKTRIDLGSEMTIIPVAHGG